VTVRPRFWFGVFLFALCALLPPIAAVVDQPFYVDIFARMMIWAIAAVSLNLILGYGAMVSFGHAVYIGIAAYTVAIFAYYDVTSGWIQWPSAVALCAVVALLFGIVSLRTRGVYFIMISMALAQMVYFLAVSAEEFGSDDGLVIYDRSEFGFSWFDLDQPLTRYYTILAALVGCVYLSYRLVNSRFGRVIRGSRSNEQRMEAMGYPVIRYRLVCFVIAGAMCGVAGILSANVEKFVSPDVMYWTKSGELIFMVVLGGMGSLLGPIAGAMVFWLLAEFLAGLTEHWHLIFGPFLVLTVLFARRGIDGLFDWRGRKS